MKHRIGKIFMVMGILLLGGAVGLFIWNQSENKRAVEASQNVLKEMQEIARDDTEDSMAQDTDAVMQEMVIDGHGYIGYVTIPTLGVQLPVMSELDSARLKIAPCRYYGSTYSDDLVIAGHNYRGHFGSLNNMKIGDEVWFTDVTGVSSIYLVEEVQILEAFAIEEMNSGSYDLSLFTCTYGGESRFVLRCMRK